MNGADIGDPRCPDCGKSEWKRAHRLVIGAPVTGEVLAVRDPESTGDEWTCGGCGRALENESAVALLDAIAD